MVDFNTLLMPIMMLINNQNISDNKSFYMAFGMILTTMINKSTLQMFYKFCEDLYHSVFQSTEVCYEVNQTIFTKDGRANSISYTYSEHDVLTREIFSSINKVKYQVKLILNDLGLNIRHIYILKPLYLGSDIYITTDLSKKTIDSNGTYSTLFTSYIYVKSNNLSYMEINKYIKTLIKKYREMDDLASKVNNIRYINVVFKRSDRAISHTSYVYKSTKTFNNMFFEQKNKLIDRLTHFRDNESQYKKLGIPYTLGIMLHGVPGTGKTSCIKAIANFLKRNLIIIPTNCIDNINDLNTACSSFAVSQCIYVIEEIDCGAWRDIIWSRDLDKEKKCVKENNTTNKIVVINKKMESNSLDSLLDDTNHEFSSKYDQKKLTLAELLDFMDGIIEHNSRIMIFTTNKPEILDPALLRPGRIDMSIEMKKMRRCDVNSMFKLWFDMPIPDMVYSRMIDHEFTQAELGQLFTSNDMETIYNTLRSSNI